MSYSLLIVFVSTWSRSGSVGINNTKQLGCKHVVRLHVNATPKNIPSLLPYPTSPYSYPDTRQKQILMYMLIYIHKI